MQDPVDDNGRYIWNTFYFNREDNRIIVPKQQRGLGFTFNFARPATYGLLIALLLLVWLLARTA
ncbi:DUF5808 domain-containing protein [Paraflavitalea pollutisoli]|uniref:DUF5808 domain-containing protein n=1 Tax=Paraflavitalea pollutisoli TaxID=3034143 RepID=UPI0023ED4C2E|nr:DUF5808 domain-containing protein [Paraflavitalea sp. H1-2-19X]